MTHEKTIAKNPFSPQYCIINKSEPNYDLIKRELLTSARFKCGNSLYFVRADRERGCICRIRIGNGTALFYEILNHAMEGISEEEIQEALSDPENACPLPGYYHITPKINEKLQKIPLRDAACPISIGMKEGFRA